MSSKLLKGIAVVLLLAAAGFGMAAFFIAGHDTRPSAQPAQNALPDADTPPERVEVVVARHDIAPFVALDEADLKTVTMARPDADFASTAAPLVGRMSGVALAGDAIVAPKSLISFSDLAQRVPPGTQAISIAVNDTVAVGGLVAPGDLVDVLIYLRASGRDVEKTQVRVLLQKIRLLALGGTLVGRTPDSADAGNRRSRQTTAVLAVPKADVARLLLGDEAGDLRLALFGETEARRLAVSSLQGTANTSAADADSKTDGDSALTLDALTGRPAPAASPPRRRLPVASSSPRTIEVFRGNESTRVNVP